jgi:hypothetical protein
MRECRTTKDSPWYSLRFLYLWRHCSFKGSSFKKRVWQLQVTHDTAEMISAVWDQIIERREGFSS